MLRTNATELLDREADTVAPEELAGNLRDIRRANRFLGGTRAVLRALAPVLGASGGEVVSVLDVATGSADIPQAIVGEARRRGWRVRVLATDVQPSVLAVARAAELPGVLAVEQADARTLPYADGSFDVVTLSLALHHFAPEDALVVLSEMRRVGKRLLVVNDLERSRAGYAGAWLVGHALTRNRLTRHDAPLSVRRAYTRGEALALARRAGWHAPKVRGAIPFRYVLTGSSEPDG
jgi:SAM-dependent methyltransferase